MRRSPALIVALVALVVAMAGTSVAAVTLAKNSVGTPQLQKNAVTSPKVKDNTLTGADINESKLKLPKQRGVVRLTAGDFGPRITTQEYLVSSSRLLWTSGDPSFIAGLHLPDGATITKITGYGVDNNDGDDIEVLVLRTLGSDASGAVTHAGGTGSMPSGLEPKVFNVGSAGPVGPVDNDLYSYMVYVNMGASALGFDSLKVEYLS